MSLFPHIPVTVVGPVVSCNGPRPYEASLCVNVMKVSRTKIYLFMLKFSGDSEGGEKMNFEIIVFYAHCQVLDDFPKIVKIVEKL